MTYVWLARRVATITKYLVLLVAVPRERDGRGAPKIQSDLLAPNLCHDAHLLSPSLPQIVVFYTFSEGSFFLIEALLFPERDRLSPLPPTRPASHQSAGLSR